MKKGRYLILGLFPLTVSAALLQQNASALPENNVTINAQNQAGTLPAGKVEGDNVPVNEQISMSDTIEQLILVNADSREVIGMLEKLTGRTALMEQKLPSGPISIEVQDPITRLEAIAAIESVLSLNGIAVVDMGENFIKVVASKTALSQSPEIIDGSLLEFEPTQRICSKFFKLRYYDASEFQRTVKSILTPSSSNVIVFPFSNSLFITDTAANLQRVETLIQRTDSPIQMVEDVKFIPLNNVKASAIVKKFDQLKRGSLKKYLSNITIDSDDSSNQLIIIAQNENFPFIENIAKQLDNKCELLLKSEVIRIKHGDAKKITEIVSNIIKEQRSRLEKENQMAFERQQAQMTAQGSLANALAQAASGSRSNQQISNTYSEFISSQQVNGEMGEEQMAQFSSNLTLASDERSNSIIIYGTSSDLSQVRNLITNLDVLLDQVRIEVIVAQVTYGKNQQSGLESFNFSHATNSTRDDTYGAKIGNHELLVGTTFSGGSSFNGTLKNFALNTVFAKAKTDSNVKILSNPTLVTTHNRKANFKIGEEQPFVDSSTQSDEKDSKERIQIIYKHVGFDLTITPLIGNNGIIQMEISQKISKQSDKFTVGSFTVPVVSEKEINSFISVASSDVIVLAGFKERQETKTSGKIFLLGDLPIIGNALFSPKTREETTTELIIFIKPTIILRPQDEADYLNKRLAVTNFKKDIEHYNLTGDFLPTQEFPKDTVIGLNKDDLDAELGRKKKKKISTEPTGNFLPTQEVPKDKAIELNKDDLDAGLDIDNKNKLPAKISGRRNHNSRRSKIRIHRSPEREKTVSQNIEESEPSPDTVDTDIVNNDYLATDSDHNTEAIR